MAVVNIQLKDFDQTAELLLKISPSSLGQRIYLFYGTYAEYYFETRNLSKALEYIKLAILHTSNISERQFLENRKQVMSRALS